MLRDTHLNDDRGGSVPSPCSRSVGGPASSLGPTEVGGFQGLSEHRRGPDPQDGWASPLLRGPGACWPSEEGWSSLHLQGLSGDH